MEHIKGAGVCTPLGFTASAVSADIKGNGKNRNDFTLLYSEVPFRASAIFTKNRFKAAPLLYCQEVMGKGKEYYGIAVNSGNANACTGEAGLEDCRTIAAALEAEIGVPYGSILLNSTGVIGVPLPVDRMVEKTGELVDELDSSQSDLFAEAIMTTDSVSKEYSVLVETDNGAYVVAGAAKGAGMIAPGMATMLAFITTDAMVNQDLLDESIKEAAEDSFNSITVDGDMSTNDSVYLFSNGMSGIIPNRDEFKAAVLRVCLELAKMIVRDGEGATKLCEVNVKGAKSPEDAEILSFALANSPLFKTMLHGEDPNWGRIMATIGASRVNCEQGEVDIYFEDLKYVEGGLLINPELESKAAEIMKQDELTITIDLNAGSDARKVYTCDLTREYIAINADYRS
ncbi:bifunctional glutamate N-acetyltransferase/amino-acid acetyltransferase ArgJ [Limisalsivibrio acetivorans]|uniref:bifunctional glutamate N-acetyltransferase/amino-acid acetyltransferase ArgJ n=1 Tax=Limisalsivibrio acetivorans TaxID=1304888 RepID=UPI0003B4E8D2|nr:bifunctional glutamate N-acetyltransferase/amino-acid acetyltransferase ArgJ [Limisalsivibrio acetivorans]